MIYVQMPLLKFMLATSGDGQPILLGKNLRDCSDTINSIRTVPLAGNRRNVHAKTQNAEG